MNHITLFDEACALIFTSLYERFPISYDFDQRDIGFYQRADMSPEADLRRQVLKETLIFLGDEGYIQFKYHGPDPTYGLLNARLTAKGLANLQRTPDGIKPGSKSLIDQLTEAMESIGERASAAVVTEVIRRILTMVFGG